MSTRNAIKLKNVILTWGTIVKKSVHKQVGTIVYKPAYRPSVTYKVGSESDYEVSTLLTSKLDKGVYERLIADTKSNIRLGSVSTNNMVSPNDDVIVIATNSAYPPRTITSEYELTEPEDIERGYEVVSISDEFEKEVSIFDSPFVGDVTLSYYKYATGGYGFALSEVHYIRPFTDVVQGEISIETIPKTEALVNAFRIRTQKIKAAEKLRNYCEEGLPPYDAHVDKDVSPALVEIESKAETVIIVDEEPKVKKKSGAVKKSSFNKSDSEVKVVSEDKSDSEFGFDNF